MRDYIITTDSNSDLPPSLVEAHHMTIVPQYYAFGDTVYGDELNMTPSEFYAKMRTGEMPTSMANNPEVIRSRFEPIVRAGKDILHIAFSSALSGSYNNVMMVANELMEEYPDTRILVLDTLNVSMGESLQVMRAWTLQEEGRTLEEVYQILEAEKLNYHTQFTVSDLFHLQRGGRVSKTTAIIGSIVNVKPLLTLSPEGNLLSAGTARGRKKSISALVKRMQETLPEKVDYNRPVAIVHADCPDDAAFLKQLVEELGFTNIFINDVSPSIGVHAGPGAIGLLYYGVAGRVVPK